MSNSPQKPLTRSEVHVVEASAGSGKTYCLARRYVQLLLNPRLSSGDILLRNILAITFTNKAAYTMKARILEFLKKIALGELTPAQEKEILSPLGLTSAQARPQALRIMDVLIHHYNFFQVQTIDSFIKSLLAGCSFNLGLSAGFKIKRNYADYLELSFDRLIDQSTHNKDIYEILARFLNNYLFYENKSGWFPKKDMLSLLNALYNQTNTYGRDFVAWNISADDLIIRKKKIMGLLRQLQENLPERVHKKFREGLDKFLEKYQDGFDFDALPAYLSWPQVPVTKNEEISSQLGRLWETLQKELQQLAELEAYTLFNPYVDVFSYINRDFHAKAREDDVLFLPELNRRARLLFDEQGVSVEELYYRLATRLEHYLLDEFQDTSLLQWRNLELMIEEALSTGGSFFYVGDKKQAIYGFRGGEVKLFDEVKERFSQFNVCLESLSINYRSQKVIVEFNNAVFAPENLRRYILCQQEDKEDALPLSPDDVRDVEFIFQGAKQSVPAEREGGYVRIENLEAENKINANEEIRQKLFSLIVELKNRFSYDQIAILTRSNTEIELVTGWLLSAGIPAESERTLNIKKNPLILELVALLQFLNSPIDNLSFAKFISGEIFQKASDVPKEEIENFLFRQRSKMQEKERHYLYRAFREEYESVWDSLFDDFFKNVGLVPLYELATSILRRFSVCSFFRYEHGFFMRFLELIKDKEEEYSDLDSFLEHFEDFDHEELFVEVVNSNAIKILTTHKAKGLEFSVVILPFLGIEIHAATGGETGQQAYIVDAKDKDLRLLRIKEKYRRFSTQLEEIHRVEKVKSFLAEINSTYVALTRAQKELYAFIPPKIGNSRNLIKYLIPPEIYECGKPSFSRATLKPAHSDADLISLAASGEYDWINFLQEEFSETTSIKKRVEVRKGAVLHQMLSNIGNIAHKNLEQVVAGSIQASRAVYPLITNWDDYKESIRRILSTKDLSRFFEISDAEVFLEKELVGRDGKTRRVDRLIVMKDEIWVVDYKSSSENVELKESFRNQVREYKKILGEIHASFRVKGFLLYINEAEFEEVV